MQAPLQALLAKLIAFDTTSHLSNLQLIEWVKTFLQNLGVQSHLTFSPEGNKANLFAVVGPENQPVLVLSGHSDVVPVTGQAWHSDPFVLRAEAGRLYGRGTADMKGFIACVLDWLPAVQAMHQAGQLQTPVALALSFDEEVGCLGVHHLIQDLQARAVPVSACVVGEPTLMHPVIAHKGIAHFRCTVRGRSAHSSLTPQGVNAIEFAARLINHIRELADAEARSERSRLLFDVPFTTLQTGCINGGTAANIIPLECSFVFECRCLPGEELDRLVAAIRDYADTLLVEMRVIAPESSITLEPLLNCPPFELQPENPWIDLLLAFAPEREQRAVAYATEAACFSAVGYPCVVMGPGSIAQAHRPDEYIEESQLIACRQWLDQLLQLLSSTKLNKDPA